MAYDEKFANRIESVLKRKSGISQKKMFGGLAFLLHGNMLCGVVKDKFCARIGSKAYENALKQKHVRKMDFTGKALRGMVYVLPEGTKTKASLTRWINASIRFVHTLPEKKPARRK